MNDLLELLNKNPWLNLLFILLAILGIIVTIITYSFSKKKKQLIYNLLNFKIISKHWNNVENVTIKYNNKNVKELSVCRIAIFNYGKLSIRKNDIAEKNKIRIEADKGEFLSATIQYVRKNVNNFNISVDNKTILVDFDFLGHYDGAVIKIFHTCEDINDVKVKGTIIDGGNILLINNVGFVIKYSKKLSNWINKGKYFILIKFLISIPIIIPLIIIEIYNFIVILTSNYPIEYNFKEDNWM